MTIPGKIYIKIIAKDLTYVASLTDFLIILLNETKSINIGILIKSHINYLQKKVIREIAFENFISPSSQIYYGLKILNCMACVI